MARSSRSARSDNSPRSTEPRARPAVMTRDPGAVTAADSPAAPADTASASLGRRYRAYPRRHARARGSARRGGLCAAVDGGRESGQMASGPHQLVLRDLCARAARQRLHDVSSGVPDALQLLLRCGRRQVPPGRARADLAPFPRRHRSLSRACRRSNAQAARAQGPRPRGRADRTGAAARTAAPGTDPHRRQAPSFAQSAAACVPTGATAGTRAAPTHEMGGVRRRPRRIRPRRSRLRVRQRNASPPGVRRAIRAGVATGHARRVCGVHRRWRLPAPRTVAGARLGMRAAARLDGAALLADGRRPVADIHAARNRRCRPAAAGRACQLLRSGRFRALGTRAAPDRIRMGARGARRSGGR